VEWFKGALAGQLLDRQARGIRSGRGSGELAALDDAFTACLAHYYLRGHSLENLSELANRFASWVATQRGATPAIRSNQLQDILNGVAVR
jgi:hypothetical protein